MFNKYLAITLYTEKLNNALTLLLIQRHNLMQLSIIRRELLSKLEVEMKILAILTLVLLLIAITSCNNQTTNQANESQKKENQTGKGEEVQRNDDPTIRIMRIPGSPIDKNIPVTWKIETGKSDIATNTAIFYDKKSHGGYLGKDVVPEKSGYPSYTKETYGEKFSLPAQVFANVKIPSGSKTVYLRAHATINGKHYWTDEFTINVS